MATFDSNQDQEPGHNFLETHASIMAPGSITVLIVDDHTIIRAALHQVLTGRLEIKRVVMAQNYAEAEKQAAQLLPDIIWLDLHIGNSESTYKRPRKIPKIAN